MRILLVNQVARYEDGGGNRVVMDTLEWLREAGHEVALAIHEPGPNPAPGDPPGPARPSSGPHPQVFAPESTLTSTAHAEWLDQVVTRFRPDVIQNHARSHVNALRSIADRVPLAVFLHDQTWFCSSGDRTLRHYQPCQRPHGVGCLVQHYAGGCGGRSPLGNWQRFLQADDCLRLLRHPRVRIQVASRFMEEGLRENGVDMTRVDRVTLYGAPPRPVHAQEDPGAVEPGLVFAPARLFPSKGIHVLLEALAGIRDVPWALEVAGKGPQLPALESLVTTLHIGGRVRFLGEIPPAAMESHYRRAQIVAFPVLRPEPFGLVGVESLAHGKPIVAFSGGAVSEWLWPEETGILVSPHSTESYRTALRTLLTQPEKCRQMGQAARHHYADFTPGAYLSRLLESLRRAGPQRG